MLVTPVKRGGFWYVVKRVPRRFAAYDNRRVCRISTHIRIAEDPKCITAAKIAQQIVRDLEGDWIAKANGGTAPKTKRRYDDAIRVTGVQGFDYLTVAELVAKPLEELGRRLEKIINQRWGDAPTAVEALLGGVERPVIMLSQLVDEFEEINKAALAQMSEVQRKKWRSSRDRVLRNVVSVIGDKALGAVTRADALKYKAALQDRIVAEEITVESGNKEINSVSAMWRAVDQEKRLGLEPHFRDLAFKGGIKNSRPAYSVKFIQDRILAPGALDGLEVEARRILLVMIETGLRPSEIANLTARTIHTDAEVPFIEVKPEGRVLKAAASKRRLPVVGVALAALKLQPEGFPGRRNNSRLSQDINEFLTEASLRETPEHSLYSLRHSFEDRLDSLKVLPDKIQAYLMGHKYSRPKYGSEPPLTDLQEWLDKIAFKRFPDRL